MSIRTLAIGLFCMYAILLMPAAAHAQFAATPFSDPATGERYHIEAVVRLVEPVSGLRDRERVARHARHAGSTPSPTSASRRRRSPSCASCCGPARKHKFRINYLPMTYTAAATVHREFVFNGIRYGVNLPVTTELSWKTWLLGYEYDFLYRDRWFVGIRAAGEGHRHPGEPRRRRSLGPSSRARRRRSRRSAASGASTSCRTSRSPASSIGFKIPESINERLPGALLRLRSVRHGELQRLRRRAVRLPQPRPRLLFEDDHGDFKMKGIYFGGVVRY